jgi:hypothetical protein
MEAALLVKLAYASIWVIIHSPWLGMAIALLEIGYDGWSIGRLPGSSCCM